MLLFSLEYNDFKNEKSMITVLRIEDDIQAVIESCEIKNFYYEKYKYEDKQLIGTVDDCYRFIEEFKIK